MRDINSLPSASQKARASMSASRRVFAQIDLRDLELFVAIAEAGSITHGAQHEHLSLPAASARLRAMERAVGTALVVRGRRGGTPAEGARGRRARAGRPDAW